MNLTNQVKDSLKYPFFNISKWMILSVLVIIGNLLTVVSIQIWDDALFEKIMASDLVLIFTVIFFIITIYILGYAIGIVKCSIDLEGHMPSFNVKNDFINGLEHAVILLFYLIIPFIFYIAMSFAMGVNMYGFDFISFSFTETVILTANESIMFETIPSLNVWIVLIISFVVFLIFGLFEVSSLCRFAKTGSLKESFNFKDVWVDVKKSSVKLALGICVICVTTLILGFLLSFWPILPFGILIFYIGYSFLIIFKYRLLGLIYME